jgi:LPS-assembly lipoprotein
VDGESQPAGAADYTLVVIDDQRIRTVQATNTSGQVRELKLRVQFRWTLVDTENKEVLPPQTALYEQDLSFNETQALGKAEEEALIFETLQQRAVAAVINQLARINR